MTNETMNRRDLLGAAAVVAAASVVAGEAAAQAPAGRMTVHILDLFSGTPANGAKVELFMKEGDAMKLVKTVMTGPSGRPDAPLLQGETFAPGRYMVAFDLTDYFKGVDKSLPRSFENSRNSSVTCVQTRCRP